MKTKNNRSDNGKNKTETLMPTNEFIRYLQLEIGKLDLKEKLFPEQRKELQRRKQNRQGLLNEITGKKKAECSAFVNYPAEWDEKGDK